jgi:6-pyruvoyl tetrahydropterin synthase/QueD family protein
MGTKRHRIRVRRRFEAAHRIATTASDCWHLHGHSFEVFYTLGCSELKDGMVVDSNHVKAVVDKHIFALDHAVIIDDALSCSVADCLTDAGFKVVQLANVPTAEYLAQYFFQLAKPALPQLLMVEVRETENLIGVFMDEDFSAG